MNESTHEKITIAVEYLDLAMVQYVKGENYFSALHLAGAAGEILGKIARLAGHKDELSHIAEIMYRWGEIVGTLLPIKQNKKYVNKIKNSIKHINSINDLTITVDIKKECEEVIERAIINFNLLRLPVTDSMLSYFQYVKNT